MPKLSEFAFGTKGKMKQASTLSPEQQKLYALIEKGITSGTGSLGSLFGDFNEDSFNKGVAEPALKNFQDKILPQLQQQYIGQGQAHGSGMRDAQLRAGTDLQSKLAELMYGAQNQQQQNKLQGVNTLFGKQAVENTYKPGTEGAVQGFVRGAGEGFGKATGNWIAG